jgi:TRAP-type C4-dicarboxylate transport system substrate-binding protein
MAKRIWKHMGCNITVIAWAEAYLALKQGMVEAITTPMNLTYDMKFHEVAPYITNINEFLQMECIGVNKPKWDKLPADIQKVMIDAFNTVAKKANDELEGRVETDIQKMLSQGAFFIRTSLESFSDKVAPLAAQLEAEGQWDEGRFEAIRKLSKK